MTVPGDSTSTTASKELTKGERTARRILEAAAHCIATIGIERTSVTQIAARAKVSRGLVMHYVPQKAKLIHQVIGHIAQRAYEEVESVPAGASPRERILHSVRRNFEFLIANPDYLKVMLLFYYYATVRADLRKINTDLNRRAIARYAQALREEGYVGDATARAELIQEQVIGAIQRFYVVEHRSTPEDFIAGHLAQIEKGILP